MLNGEKWRTAVHVNCVWSGPSITSGGFYICFRQNGQSCFALFKLTSFKPVEAYNCVTMATQLKTIALNMCLWLPMCDDDGVKLSRKSVPQIIREASRQIRTNGKGNLEKSDLYFSQGSTQGGSSRLGVKRLSNFQHFQKTPDIASGLGTNLQWKWKDQSVKWLCAAQ